MGVYIKGIEIPTGNDELRLIIHSNGQVIISHKTHYEEAEAVPVPPHGRLKDADALLSQYKGNIWTAQTDYAEGLRDIAKDIADAPTIIPAEEATQKDGGQDETQAGPYDLLYEEGGYSSNGV